MLKRFNFILVSLLLVFALAGCVEVQFNSDGSYEYKEYDEKVFSAVPTISVEGVNGSVEVLPATDGKIKVQSVKKLTGSTEERLREVAEDVKITYSPSSTHLEVKSTLPNPRPAGVNSMGVDFRVYVPTATSVKVKTTNGSINSTGLKKGLDLWSSNGSITVTNHQGNVIARTTNGSITALEVTGALKLHTSNGRVSLTSVAGDLDVETTNGRIEVTSDLVVTGARLHTSNSSINFKARLTKDGRYDISTSNGSIDLWVNKAYGYDLYAKTSNGRVQFTFPADFHGAFEKNYLNGTLAGGGVKLTATTSNGSISIHQWEGQ